MGGVELENFPRNQKARTHRPRVIIQLSDANIEQLLQPHKRRLIHLKKIINQNSPKH